MTDERDHEGNLLSDKIRLTKVGIFVRSKSIDELPLLINVLMRKDINSATAAIIEAFNGNI